MVENKTNILQKYSHKITMASANSIVAFEYGDGGVYTEVKGVYLDAVGLIAAAIFQLSDETGVDLEKVGNDINKAMAMIKGKENGK